MKDAIIAQLVESGHQIECSDLYCDRFDPVFAYGKMYGGDLFFENGIGRGKRALLTVTTGGPAGAYASTGLNPPIDLVLGPIHQGIFWFLGYEPIAPFVAFGPRAQSEAQRSDTLARLTRHISQIETLPRLAFPRRQDFRPSPKLLP
jgi:NAD(P)H dehydrogenase (quinone)